MDEITREIQIYLRSISRYDSDIPSVIPDGIFGAETTAAVKTFQRKQNLEESGEVNLATWEKLIEQYDESVLFFSQPNQVAPIRNSDLPLKKGKNSTFNQNLKLMLNRLAERYRNLDLLPVNEVFDDATEAQVTVFRKIIAKEPDGEVDKETWNRLSELYVITTEE